MLGIVSLGVNTASANTGAGAAFDAHYVTNSTCTSCHSGTPGSLYALATSWKNSGGTSQAGPTTQTGWDTLDATYKTTYGGIEPTWTLSTTTTTTQSQASTTGCMTSSMATPAILLGMLMLLGLMLRRKQEVKVNSK